MFYRYVMKPGAPDRSGSDVPSCMIPANGIMEAAVLMLDSLLVVEK